MMANNEKQTPAQPASSSTVPVSVGGTTTDDNSKKAPTAGGEKRVEWSDSHRSSAYCFVVQLVATQEGVHQRCSASGNNFFQVPLETKRRAMFAVRAGQKQVSQICGGRREMVLVVRRDSASRAAARHLGCSAERVAKVEKNRRGDWRRKKPVCFVATRCRD